MNPIRRKDEMYLVRKERREFEDILTGRENTMLINGECFLPDELIRFIEWIGHKRTGRECFCRVEHIFGKRLVKYRKVRMIDVHTKKQAYKTKRKKA